MLYTICESIYDDSVDTVGFDPAEDVTVSEKWGREHDVQGFTTHGVMCLVV